MAKAPEDVSSLKSTYSMHWALDLRDIKHIKQHAVDEKEISRAISRYQDNSRLQTCE